MVNPAFQHLFKKGAQQEDFYHWMKVVASDATFFHDFWALAKDENVPNHWRALWVIEHAIKINPQLLEEIIDPLYHLMIESTNNSLLRIGLKLICQRPVPANELSVQLLNKCEDLLLSSKTPIATRANSLEYLFAFCKTAPDFIQELESIMDHLAQQDNSSGMKARMRHIQKACMQLKELN